MYPFAQHYARVYLKHHNYFQTQLTVPFISNPCKWSYFIYSEMKLPTWSANLFSKEERSTWFTTTVSQTVIWG